MLKKKKRQYKIRNVCLSTKFTSKKFIQVDKSIRFKYNKYQTKVHHCYEQKCKKFIQLNEIKVKNIYHL